MTIVYSMVYIKDYQGPVAGSVSRAHDSRSWGHKSEPHAGYRHYLKNNILKKI